MMEVYKVIVNSTYKLVSPLELQRWLDEQYEDGYELVAVTGAYFIFKKRGF